MGINIGFDADGVLFDTEFFQLSQKSIMYMQKHFGLNVADLDGYGIKDVFACDTEIEMCFWTHFVLKYSLGFKARPWVKETIAELRRQKNRVYIVTSKACALEKNYKGIAVRFLFELGLKWNGILVDDIKYCSLENSAEDKLRVCQENNISIMVEDKKENIERLSQKLFVLCFSTRNNRGYYGERVFRVHNFNEVYAELQRLIGIMTNTSNTFTQYSLKTKTERNFMDKEEKENYYHWLKHFYLSLPLNTRRIIYSERMIDFLNKFYAPIFYKRYKPILIGRENIREKRGIIFVCNHLCSKDMLLLLYGIYGRGVYWHPLIKKEILDKKIGMIFEAAYSVFVERTNETSRHSATQEMAKLLVNGFNVLIFPEGTYNRSNQQLKEFSGVSHVYLSQALQCPIINCALTKNYDMRPVLIIDKPYVVPFDISIEAASKDSFMRLSLLVGKANSFTARER